MVSNLASNAINTFDRKISEKETVRIGKGLTLFISNEDMNDIIKTTKSLEYLGVLINGVSETVKHETERWERGFLEALLAPLAASLGQPVVSSVVKGIGGRKNRRA